MAFMAGDDGPARVAVSRRGQSRSSARSPGGSPHSKHKAFATPVADGPLPLLGGGGQAFPLPGAGPALAAPDCELHSIAARRWCSALWFP